MITLLTTIVSFLTGGLPKLLDFFQDRGDKKHELALARLQMERELELQKAGFQAQRDVEEIKLDEIKVQTAADQYVAQVQAAQAERSDLYNHDIQIGKGASQWVINLRAIVRPVITFGFFSLLVFVDVFGFYYAIRTGVAFNEALNILWTQETQVLFSSIIAFWFGTQAFGSK